MPAKKRKRRWLLWLILLITGFTTGILLSSRQPSSILRRSIDHPVTVTAIEEIIPDSRLTTITADFEAIQSESLQQTRRIFPDGHISYFRRSFGQVSVGIDLGQARARVEPLRGGPGLSQELQVWLPEPEIQPVLVDYANSEINTSHDMWTAHPTDNALAMSHGCREALPEIVVRQAVLSGFVERARTEAIGAVTRLGRALGFERVSVAVESFPSEQITDLFPTPVQEVPQMHLAMPGFLRGIAIIILGSIAALVTFPRTTTNSQDATADSVGSVLSAGLVTSAEAAVLFERLQAVSRFDCATYNGMVYLQDSIQQKILGVTVGHTRLWASVPGFVYWSIDLGQLRREDVTVTEAAGRRTIEVVSPPPGIIGCEIDARRTLTGRNSSAALLEDDEEISRREEGLLALAQDELQSQAVDAGFQIQANSMAREQLADLVRQFSDDPGSTIEIRFRQASDPSSGQSSYDLAADPSTTVRFSTYEGR